MDSVHLHLGRVKCQSQAPCPPRSCPWHLSHHRLIPPKRHGGAPALSCIWLCCHPVAQKHSSGLTNSVRGSVGDVELGWWRKGRLGKNKAGKTEVTCITKQFTSYEHRTWCQTDLGLNLPRE